MGKTAKRPKKAKRKDLNLRQRKYVTGRLAGKSKKASALEAGYSASMARNAAYRIENASVRQAFHELARRAVPAEKIVKRLREGLDAWWISQDGKRGKTREPYFRERRAYLELAAKFGGYYTEKKDIDLTVEAEADVLKRRQRIQELIDRLKPPDKSAE